MLFESSWDTKSSNSALISSSTAKSKERRKSKDGGSGAGTGTGTGAGPSIDLDKLLKKMGDVGTEKGGKGKGKGKAESGKAGGEFAAKGGKKDKTRGTGEKAKPTAGEKAKAATQGKDKSGSTKEVNESGAGSRGPKRKAEDKPATESDRSKKRKKEKKDKVKPAPKEAAKLAESAPTQTIEEEDEEPEGMSELQQLMRKNLQGSKFRIINEKLYKSSSSDAQEMMRNEPQMYTEARFRHQTKSWPTNPVDLISTSLSTLPERSLIVDLGCGDAQLAKTLVPQGLNVLSYDLVNDTTWVVDTDICTRIPLPGNQAAVVDACVCSLSLMSTNWIGCANEVWRVLRMGGRFVVAEVTSRFRDADEFVRVLGELGFELVEQSAPSTHFLLFEFRKVERGDITDSWDSIRASAEGLLKPCEYKRR